jgi:hypothetical protein
MMPGCLRGLEGEAMAVGRGDDTGCFISEERRIRSQSSLFLAHQDP